MTAPAIAATQPRPFMRATAHRCAHCKRELPTGEGLDVPGIGPVGPECVKKYASLAPVLAQVQGMQAHEWDRGTVNLTHHTVMDLRRLGLTVRVVDVAPGVKALEIIGAAHKPKAVLERWEDMRARFELRLKLAAAERDGVAA